MNVPTLLQGPIATDAPIFIAPSFENKADVRQNAIDRGISLSLPIDVIHCTLKLQRIGAHAKEKYRDRQTDCRNHAYEHGIDDLEIAGWRWSV